MFRLFSSIIMLICLAVYSAGCASSMSRPLSLSPGTLNRTLNVDGDKRSYRLHIPESVSGEKPLPVILALHGAFSSARKMEQSSGFSALADKENFIVVYPNGIGLFGLLRHWNAGFCCGRAMKAGWKDIDFLLRLTEVLSENPAVDSRRIYLVGMSNGGMLAHRFAAEYPERAAAVALVSAAVGARWQGRGEMRSIPQPSGPVPALIMHARDDEAIPFDGGRGESRGDVEYLGPQDAAAFWREANHCGPLPAETIRVPGGLRTRWAACRDGAEVVLLAFDQGGHAWPGDRHGSSRDVRYDDGVDGAEIAWRFISRFSRD